MGIPRVSMPSFRHGLAESSHREVKGRLSTGVECAPLMPLLIPRQPSLALDSAHPWRNDEVDDGGSVCIPKNKEISLNLIAVTLLRGSAYGAHSWV